MFYIGINLLNIAIILCYAAYFGWFGEAIQAKMVLSSDVNHKYDREVLLAIAQVQSGSGHSFFNSDGMVEIDTSNIRVRIHALDFADENFGECYSYQRKYGDNYRSDNIRGTLSYSTRKYLLEFKEDYLGISDPSSSRKKGFNFKKETITIK